MFAAAQNFSPETPYPRLVFPSRSFEFGSISPTQTVRHVFTVGNSGATNLLISRVQSCCGLSSTLSGTNIPSGKTESLELVLSPVDISGPVKKTVYIHTNDRQARIVSYRLSGCVIPSPSSTNAFKLAKPPCQCR